MKKRLFSLFTSLFMVISMVGVLPAVTASALTYGDYEYAVNSNGTVKITSYNGNASTLSIPSTINGKKVTIIGEGAFEYCTNPTNITIPNSVTHIGEYAFGECDSLTSITIPNSVTSIGDYAFYSCESLKSVIIGNSVKSIGDYAFRKCESLKDVYYTGTQTQWKSIVIGEYNYLLKYATIHYNYNPKSVPTVTGFKVAATSAQAVKLTCNKVSGATGYVFYRAVSGKWKRVGVSKTNTFTETKLKSGTSYRYAVKAYKTVGGKNYYSASYPTLWTSTNPATVSFTLTAGSKKAVAKWTKTTGATGYIVYMKTTAKASWQKIATTKSLSYTKTGLVKGKTYWFTVKAYRTANGKTYNGAFVTKSVKVK